MLSPTTGVNRVIRALALGMTCIVITVAGHSAAHGHMSPLGIGIVGAVMVLLAALATSRELTLGQLIAFAGLSQVASHLMLTILAPHSSTMGSSRPLAAFDSSQSLLTGNHIHAAMSQEMPMSMPMSPSFHAVNSSLDLPSMVILHAAMCVVMALLLRHGEQLYFRLHHVLPHVLRVLVGTAIARSAVHYLREGCSPSCSSPRSCLSHS